MSKLNKEKQAAIQHGRRLLNREFPEEGSLERIQKIIEPVNDVLNIEQAFQERRNVIQ